MPTKTIDDDLFCSNCYIEFDTKEMGLYIRGYDNSVTGFCPNCGWIEVIPAKKLDEDPELSEFMEKKAQEQQEIFTYPNSRVIRYPPENWQITHKKELERWRKYCERLSEIEEYFDNLKRNPLWADLDLEKEKEIALKNFRENY
jgi:hypothetical protein